MLVLLTESALGDMKLNTELKAKLLNNSLSFWERASK